MLLQCEQCGLLSNVMIKMPGAQTTVEPGKIIFEFSSKNHYVNLCLYCIGVIDDDEREDLTT